MSLNGALQVGRTALTASQAAIQVAGNNMANAATEGFHRRSVHLAPIRGEVVPPNAFIGQGVQLMTVRREIDLALQARFRGAVSQEQSSLIDQRFLSSLEAIQGELTENDLSSLMSAFFGAFSELANAPNDNAIRSVVIQQGVSLAGRIGDIQRQYSDLRREVDQRLGVTVERASALLDEVARLNREIVTTESGQGEASALRDQRDRAIDELAAYAEITVINQASGAADVLIGSVPVVLGSVNRGMLLRVTSEGGQTSVSLRVAADGTTLAVRGGELGGLMRQRSETIDPAIDRLETFSLALIHEVNRAHSQGQGTRGMTSVAGTYGVNDTTAMLNAAGANLPFQVGHGSFRIHVTHTETGARSTMEIPVSGNAQSLDDLVQSINAAIPAGAAASIGADRNLVLTASAGFELSFSDDTSGVLAALGINTFFTGRSAATIAVQDRIIESPGLLAAGAGHLPGSNGTALAIADLGEKALDALGGRSLREHWRDQVSDLAVRTARATTALASAAVVRESLYAQIQSVSGVSLDEEAMNLLTFQRQFQAAARFVSVIDESIQTLLSLVR